MKTSTQLKALLRNLSNKSNIEAEILLRNFMLERFLERVSLSNYKHNFILKGGMLISAIVGIDTRTTMDLDATLKAQTLSETEITTIITEILQVPIDDEVEFTFRKIEQIHDEADYPGYRITMGAAFDKTRQILKIDITTGDFITPKEIEYSFKLMLEDRVIQIMAYNIETVLSEKLEAIITRGVANTRMRDFYDIYILTKTQKFDMITFKKAFRRTVNVRQTIDQTIGAEKVIGHIENDLTMTGLWKRYQKQYSYAGDISWDMVVESVRNLITNLTPHT